MAKWKTSAECKNREGITTITINQIIMHLTNSTFKNKILIIKTATNRIPLTSSLNTYIMLLSHLLPSMPQTSLLIHQESLPN